MSRIEWSKTPIRVATLTVSDTRVEQTDKGGKLVQKYILTSGNHIVDSAICKDDIGEIQAVLTNWRQRDDIDIIITTGGTGIARRDVTIEAVEPLCDKMISGFGELFRHISYVTDVGTRAMASRAIAGTLGNKIVYSIPGSPGAVLLAMEKLILPEMLHLLNEVRK